MSGKPFEIDFVFLGNERPSLDLFEEVQKGFWENTFRGGMPVSTVNPETGVSKWLEYVREKRVWDYEYEDRHSQLFHIVPTKDCKIFVPDEEGKNLEPYLTKEDDYSPYCWVDMLKLSKDYDAVYISQDFLEEKHILDLVRNGGYYGDNMTEGLFMNKDKFMVLDDKEYEEYKKYPAEYENKMRARKCLQKKEVEEKSYHPWDIDFVHAVNIDNRFEPEVEEKFNTIENYSSKPHGGIWTSPMDHSTGLSAWSEYVKNEVISVRAEDYPSIELNTYKNHIVPTSDCTLLIVDHIKKVIPYLKPSRMSAHIDFEMLSRDYDAVYFPQEVVDKFKCDVLACWDVATCLFMSKDKFMILNDDDYVEYRQNPKEYEKKMLYKKSWRHKEPRYSKGKRFRRNVKCNMLMLQRKIKNYR